jgi:hypothetical protein
MSKNSVNNTKNGRYTLGGTTEVSMFAIEWWEKNKIDHHPSDIVYYIEKQYAFKPTLLGYLFYGDTSLWWVVCQANGIIDPMTELYEGRLLLIPTMDRVKAELFSNNVKAGGIPSTRNV